MQPAPRQGFGYGGGAGSDFLGEACGTSLHLLSLCGLFLPGPPQKERFSRCSTNKRSGFFGRKSGPGREPLERGREPLPLKFCLVGIVFLAQFAGQESVVEKSLVPWPA